MSNIADVYNEYDNYILTHCNNVWKGYEYMKENIPQIFDGIDTRAMDIQIAAHDASKRDDEEFDAYARHFYGDDSMKMDTSRDFDKAWLHHIHNNPHHWEYWLLPQSGHSYPIPLDMPKVYILEMIADWWSFSWKTGNLNEIFSWYDNNRYKMMFTPVTEITVETILKELKDSLQNE